MLRGPPYLTYSCSLNQASAGQGWPAASLKGRSSLLARPREPVWTVYCCHLVVISGSTCLAPIGACAPLTNTFLQVPGAYSIQPEDTTLALLLADHRVLEISNFLPASPSVQDVAQGFPPMGLVSLGILISSLKGTFRDPPLPLSD